MEKKKGTLTTIYNPKGGTGKTTLSFSLCLDLDYYYSTNDTINSSIVLNNYEKVIDTITNKDLDNKNIIFDGGGFIDKKILNILKISNKIIIPIETDLTSLSTFEQVIEELQEINHNIYVVINKVDNKNDLKDTLTYLKSKGIDNSNIFEIRKTRLFKRVLSDSVGVNELLKDNKLNQYLYNKVYKEYTKLLKII